MTALAFTERDVLASLGRDSLYEFVREFWPWVSSQPPVWNWHIRVLCLEMQRMIERVIRGEPSPHDYVINVPMGTTKSTVVSEMLPPWAWTRQPALQFICGSHTSPIALDLARRSRNIVLSPTYQACYGEKVQLESEAVTMIINTSGGFRLAVGTGHVLGFHGHVILIDDPVDPESTNSVADREAAVKWMAESLSTRKVDKVVTPTVLVMQRLGLEDPSGLMLGQIKDKRWGTPVKHLCLPAATTYNGQPTQIKPEKFRHYYDESGLLDPIRLPQKIINEYTIRLGKLGAACQLYQDPFMPGGGLIKVEKFRYETTPPLNFTHFKHLVRFWDKAGTADGGKRTAGVLLGIDLRDRVWILDVVIGQWSAGDREAVIKSTAGRDGADIQIGVEQEPGSGGKESAENTVRNLMGYSCTIHLPTGDKAQRADPFAVQADIGNVYLPKGAPWIPEYTEELRYFPEGKFSDQTDATSGAFNKAMGDNLHLGALFRKR